MISSANIAIFTSVTWGKRRRKAPTIELLALLVPMRRHDNEKEMKEKERLKEQKKENNKM